MRPSIDWARARGGLILEDDYDGEFRYDRKPVGAVQGLDPERVVYVGSVSKSLSPALRLGWMVLPRSGRGCRRGQGRAGGVGERAGPAGARGLPGLGVVRPACAADAAAVPGAARPAGRGARRSGRPHVEVTGIAAGLHAVLRLPPGTEQSVVKAAMWQRCRPRRASRSSGIRRRRCRTGRAGGGVLDAVGACLRRRAGRLVRGAATGLRPHCGVPARAPVRSAQESRKSASPAFAPWMNAVISPGV